MPFAMPMFNDFVPERLRPWIYVFIACCFQLSGARYLGPLNEIVGANGNMREDMLMCMYCNLAGMAVWFPMLFRMKFRFTNKTLLRTASIVVIVTNLLTGYITNLPVLWLVCFFEGIAKIQGTFECMSNIQLWMTPTRDMKVFFPILHTIILSAICLQDVLSSWFGYIGDWHLMHNLVIGLQCVVLLLLSTCVHHFRFMKLPLYGIDWTSLVLWGALLMQSAYFLDYGEFYDWYNSTQIWCLTGTILITVALIFWRMVTVRHPYINLAVFTSFRYVKPILLLIVLYEAILGTEYVLEEAFLENGLHYDTWINASLVWPVWIGNIFGCVFSFYWMKIIKNFTYIRLGVVGSCFLMAYIVGMYLLISPQISIGTLYFPLFCRGVAYACLSIMFMVSLHDCMDFEHFFQGLGVFNMLHMVIGGCVGCAIYAHGINYYVADAISRYGQYVNHVSFHGNIGHFMADFSENMVCLGAKTIYGWVAYACVVLITGFLLFDSPIRRKHPRLMQPWIVIGEKITKIARRK